MGPILIFDKSTLQSLNLDEAVWLDNFFLTNITPLFFIETLADLEKEVHSGRTPEEIVGNLAYKTPDSGSVPNAHHTNLVASEVSGAGGIDMRYGRPILSRGQYMTLGGEMGVVFQETPEEEAFHRWQKREFLEIERQIAKSWRRALSNINFEEKYKLFQQGLGNAKPKTLLDVKTLVDSMVNGPDQEGLLQLGLILMGFSPRFRQSIATLWQTKGRPLIREYAPYFTHILTVDLFFYTAIAADLISRERPSHKIDIAYLYYLPFCMIFTSNDKLHELIAPLFLKNYQTFIKGLDLKAELNKLDQHYSTLPDKIKNQGLYKFASYPPTDDSFLVTRLWDKHLSKWRQNKSKPIQHDKQEKGKEILDKMKRFEKEAIPVDSSSPINSDDVHHLLIKRKVYMRKGKWKRFPPEVEQAQKKNK